MSNRIITSLVSLLVGTSCVFAEEPAAAPDKPRPAATQAPSAVADEPTGVMGLLDGVAALFTPVADARGPHLITTEADYVLWFRPANRDVQRLASTDALSVPGARTIATFGDEHLSNRLVSGGRFGLGLWWTDDSAWTSSGLVQTAGIDTRFFFVGQRSFDNDSGGANTVVRPFFNFRVHAEDAIPVAAPGLASGSIGAVAKDDIWGAEVNAWKNLYYDQPATSCTIDAMAGFRYLEMRESVSILRSTDFASDLTAFPAFQPLAGSHLSESEFFGTRNQFYGGQVGLRAGTLLYQAEVNGTVKLALGTTHQTITINGSQVRTAADGSTKTFRGALLALPSNIGRFSNDKFTQVPELGLNIGIPIGRYLRLTSGIDALYWSRIINPANQVDRTVDVSQVPNFTRTFPGAAGIQHTGMPAFNQSSLWLVGLTFGVEVKW